VAGSKELEALIVLAGKVDPSLQKALRVAQGETTKLSKTAAKSASGLSSAGNIIKGVFVGNLLSNAVSRVTEKVRELGAQGIELASSLTEVQNVVDTTFRDNANQINKWSQTALEAFGLSELQAKQYTGTLGAMMKSSGITGQSLVTMSENLSGLSGDFASFYNLAQDDSFEKIRSGISGETEPLKQLGVNMSVANMEAFALAKGIKTSYSQMDQASQVALRYGYLMEVSKDAQGDFAKTLENSYANQKRLFDTKFQETIAKIAVKALPTLTRGFQVLNSLIDKIDIEKIGNGISKMAEKVSGFLPDILGMFQQIGPVVMDIFKQFANSPILPAIITLVQKLLPVLMSTATELGPIFSDVFSMVGGFLKDLTPVISQVVESILPLLPPLLNMISSVLKPILPVIAQIIGFLGNIINQIASALMPLFNKLLPLIQLVADHLAFTLGNAMEIVMPIIQFVADRITSMINVLTELIDFVMNVFSGNWSGAWENIKNIFGMIWNDIVDSLKGYLNIGVGFVNHFLGGFNKVAGFIGSKIGIDMQIPTIPTFAQGGFTNQPSIFGEAGLEAAIPIKYKNPRSLSLLNQTAKAIGAQPSVAGTGISLTFNFNGPVSNKEDVTNGVKMAREYILQVMEEFYEDKGRVSFA
jgi:hypothetical protein